MVAKWKFMGHARWLLQYLTSGVRKIRFYPYLLLTRHGGKTSWAVSLLGQDVKTCRDICYHFRSLVVVNFVRAFVYLFYILYHFWIRIVPSHIPKYLWTSVPRIRRVHTCHNPYIVNNFIGNLLSHSVYLIHIRLHGTIIQYIDV